MEELWSIIYEDNSSFPCIFHHYMYSSDTERIPSHITQQNNKMIHLKQQKEAWIFFFQEIWQWHALLNLKGSKKQKRVQKGIRQLYNR